MQEHVIIVAGGQGLRMASGTPKQFLPLCGLPVLMHTINQFVIYNPEISVILVLPANQIDYWNQLCLNHSYSVSHKIVKGGSSRFESVNNGLKSIEKSGITAVHDGVRPFVSIDTIKACFKAARETGASIPVIEMVESIRHVSANNSEACKRDEFRVVQTPQVFETSLLKKCYNQPFNKTFTDDASVVESAGYKIKLVEGDRENIKITSPIDMIMAEAIMLLKTEPAN